MTRYSDAEQIQASRDQPSRRGFLALAGAIVGASAAGCTVGRPGSTGSRTRAPDPLTQLLTEHASLRDSYDATIRAIGTLGVRLAPLKSNLEQHVAALAAALARKPPPPAAAASVSSAAAASSGAPIADPVAAIAALRAAESSLQQKTMSYVPNSAADRVGLLGSIAACHACHQIVLQ
ncbi:MAG: hypothetical protein ABI137_01080 [Antricoccus sp.]